jgi:hypothetical protein
VILKSKVNHMPEEENLMVFSSDFYHTSPSAFANERK